MTKSNDVTAGPGTTRETKPCSIFSIKRTVRSSAFRSNGQIGVARTTESVKRGPPVRKKVSIERPGSADRTASEHPDRSIKVICSPCYWPRSLSVSTPGRNQRWPIRWVENNTRIIRLYDVLYVLYVVVYNRITYYTTHYT
eukprot:8397734-Pyramimonas_sp.AAC.1